MASAFAAWFPRLKPLWMNLSGVRRLVWCLPHGLQEITLQVPGCRKNGLGFRPTICALQSFATEFRAKPCQWSFLPCPEWLESELIRNGLRTTNSFSGEHFGRLYCAPQSRANAPLRLSQNGLHVYRMVCSHHITLSLTFWASAEWFNFAIWFAPRKALWMNDTNKSVCPIHWFARLFPIVFGVV